MSGGSSLTPVVSGEPDTSGDQAEPVANPAADTEPDKMIALTFDDGPGEHTMRLIEGLNEAGAKATFFVVGERVTRFPNTVQFMVESGHQIGNHTYSHVDITGKSDEEFLEELERTDDALEQAAGVKSTAFRPPGGYYTKDKLELTDKTVAMWSMDTKDWLAKDAKKLKEKLVSGAKDGDIILMHDIYEPTVEGVLDAIGELQKLGFQFVTVDELLMRNGVEIEMHKPYRSCSAE